MLKVLATLAVVATLAVGGTAVIVSGALDSDRPAGCPSTGGCCSARSCSSCCEMPEFSSDPYEACLQCLALCALQGDAESLQCCLELGCNPADFLPAQTISSKKGCCAEAKTKAGCCDE
jgi:hypothetical protein